MCTYRVLLVCALLPAVCASALMKRGDSATRTAAEKQKEALEALKRMFEARRQKLPAGSFDADLDTTACGVGTTKIIKI